MNTYITVDDVDTILGPTWADPAEKERAVMEANVWLTAKGVILNDPVDEDVKIAGAYLAREAANGTLYADTTPALKRKRVKADTVESETEYQDGATGSSGIMRMIMDLLRPYLPAGGGASNFIVRRA